MGSKTCRGRCLQIASPAPSGSGSQQLNERLLSTQANDSRVCLRPKHLTLALCVVACLFQIILVESQSIEPSQQGLRRVKRELYSLPDGAELILGPNIRTTFSCDGLGYGYYADPDNDCRIFHVCQSFKMSDGSIYNNHWSFMCGNQTVFNQVSLACSHPEDAVPCEFARDFYYVNDYFGDTKAPSVKENDLSRAHELVSRAYGSRISHNN